MLKFVDGPMKGACPGLEQEDWSDDLTSQQYVPRGLLQPSLGSLMITEMGGLISRRVGENVSSSSGLAAGSTHASSRLDGKWSSSSPEAIWGAVKI